MALQSAWGNRAADSCAIAKFNAPILLFPHHAHSCSARKKSCLDLQFVEVVGLGWAQLGQAGPCWAGLAGLGWARGPHLSKAAQLRKMHFSVWMAARILQWHRALAMITALGSIKPRPTPTEFSKHLWRKNMLENFFYCVHV